MSRVYWRWAEQDFGFRFKSGGGKAKSDFYQASEPGAFYTVLAKHRKLPKERVDELAEAVVPPTSPRIVPSPWTDYDRDWDWIQGPDGILLNFAGCLDREEIERREDEGVQRAMELVLQLVERDEPSPISVPLIQLLHRALMDVIYPFAGQWRVVALHKGDGPTKWPLPPGGIEPLMEIFERDVLARSPLISASDVDVFAFASEVMNELLAVHPFREGNGRTAFILGNLILMQNDLLPLNIYDRRTDEARYFAACEAGRIRKDYAPLARLIAEWEEAALARWEADHG